MPRGADDYAKLRKTFELYEERYITPSLPQLPAEHRATAVLARQEKQSMTLARQGLRMAINDMVEATHDLAPEEVTGFDRILQGRGAYTLSALRQRYSKRYRQIIKRGMIRSDDEYYILKAIAADTSLSLPEPERKLLDAILHAYGTKLA